VFPGDSEMARRMRALDWSKTPLGSVEQWPASLRTSVSTCLDCAFPIVLWWGPELVILYNDEYMPMLGPAKHPAALGQRGAAVWPEIWDVIEPMLSQVMDRGEATRSRDLLLMPVPRRSARSSSTRRAENDAHHHDRVRFASRPGFPPAPAR
jgi:hypothetical protein